MLGLTAERTNNYILYLFATSPKYYRSVENDKRIAWDDEADADAWEVLGGGFVYVPVGENPN